MESVRTDNFIKEIRTELSQIFESDFSLRQKFIVTKRLLDLLTKELLKDESLQFPNLFSRIVFISQKYKLPTNLESNLHQIRTIGNFLQKEEQNNVTNRQYTCAYQTLEALLAFLQDGVIREIQLHEDILARKQAKNYIPPKLRVQVIDIDQEEKIIICQPKEEGVPFLSIKYGVQQVNETFDSTIESLWIGAQLNLIDCKIDNLGFYIPTIIVLEPDYLIDASAIAECFQSYGSSHLHYFRRKFEPIANTHYILLGNLANFFLDELIYAKDPSILKFNDVFLKSFQEMPFEFTACKDIKEDFAFRDFMMRAQRHFRNIQRVVTEDLPTNGFTLDQCVLEPSFYSETYGFQGRLDLLQADSEDGFMRIVELKSGKPPWPPEDVTKIAPNHEIQVSVYRLMMQSVFGKKARDIHAMILYSSSDFKGQNLRLSAPYAKLAKEIINVRNLIVATEHQLYTGNEQAVESIMEELFDSNSYTGRVPEFFENKLVEMKKILSTCTLLEKQYFYRFVSFITRELYLLKMGDEGYATSMSLSALWNTSFLERKEALELVSDLTISSIEESERDMLISFARNPNEEKIINFREGEICIVYPRQDEDDAILSNQVMKGTIINISPNEIRIRFRYKQRNKKYLTTHLFWTVEHDKLDHSYNQMYKSLFNFLKTSPDRKELLLGLKQPKSAYTQKEIATSSQDEKKKIVIAKALAATDYFLIVGPPGTGKTSVYAKSLIKEIHNQPNTDILILAYTNRAVDELCSAICSAFNEDETQCNRYIRVGSEYSCGATYRHRLLQHRARKAKNRKQLTEELQRTRIYVGTLASILGRLELFDIKNFDVAIIDEASQILEPQIIGLLPLFKKFILIGDHKQLSTITLQSEQKSTVTNEQLNRIGLLDCRESLFERFFRTAQKNKWHAIYDTLDYHGRMHQDIASLVNNSFYDGILKEINNRQINALNLKPYSTNNIEKQIATNRVLFFDIPSSPDSILSDKVNQMEAEQVVEIARIIYHTYKKNNKEFTANEALGIIAPYRNQIALIRNLLIKTGIEDLSQVMIDTVERYQGSQRDVIIVSFCFNTPYQMLNFINMNREQTVDRKLNVALTRAREQLFLVGNSSLLIQNKIYKELLSRVNANTEFDNN